MNKVIDKLGKQVQIVYSDLKDASRMFNLYNDQSFQQKEHNENDKSSLLLLEETNEQLDSEDRPSLTIRYIDYGCLYDAKTSKTYRIEDLDPSTS